MFYRKDQFIEQAEKALDAVGLCELTVPIAKREYIVGQLGKFVGPYVYYATNFFGLSHWSKELWHQSWFWVDNIHRAPSNETLDWIKKNYDLFYPPIYTRWVFVENRVDCPLCGKSIRDNVVVWGDYVALCDCLKLDGAGEENRAFLGEVLETVTYQNPLGEVEVVNITLKPGNVYQYLTLELA
ncbi:MAG: hypothetical protein GY861_20700 [bacterium]|nr:hypothetical protein [bacterium]